MELIEGNIEQVAKEEINQDDLYSIKDYPIGGITNKQMINALKEEFKKFYPNNAVFTCVDNGEYNKNHLYKFIDGKWEDITLNKEVIEISLDDMNINLVNKNIIYSISDYPIGGITNDQMTKALLPKMLGIYQVNSVYMCVDTGNYNKNHFYKFNYDNENDVYTWEDVTPNGGEGDGSSVEINSTDNPVGVANFIKVNGLNYEIGGNGGSGGDNLELLWENPNPTEPFQAQNINLSSSDYDYLEVYYYEVFDVLYINYTKVPKGYDFSLNQIYNIQGAGFYSSRLIKYINETTLQVNVAYDNSYRANANNCVPYKIYGVKSDSSSQSNENIYSTEETVVGKWIDGKTIYRKVFTGNISESNTTTNYDFSNVDTIIKPDTVKLNNEIVPIQYMNNAGYWINWYIGIDKKLHLVCEKFYVGATFNLTIEYTKTTD